MKISSDLTIEDVISSFSKKFPGLKLEMYSKAHHQGEGSQKSEEIDHSKKLSQINPGLKADNWKLDPEMTVAELEKGLKEKFGLNVQVFRRSNNLWLQTSATDDWSLEKQNTKGLHSMQ